MKKGIKSQLRKARIIITTRPIPFDDQLVRQLLPVPPAPSSESREDIFVKIAMRDDQGHREDKKEGASPEWRLVALMPLSEMQIIEFARDQDVGEPERLMEDIKRRNAQEYSRRPQDLIELCTDWRVHKRIRSHCDQVQTNVRIKLLPREDRPELAELSPDKAREGASRLALAMQLTRRLTIRHNVASDVADGEAALDPAIILSDWQPNERKALLERPLFGFASYGRVRFHHRSVAEFLAAERLWTLRERGMPFRALKRLLFATTKGKTIVRPSKRPVVGWLALKEKGIFELLRDNEPAVLLNEGDPESLTQTQRNQALRAYSDRYGQGGWRGLSVPDIQVHRFASKELAGEINQIWQEGVENSEVRDVLISLIGMGHIDACTEIVFDHALNTGATATERVAALDALVALDDVRLREIADAIAKCDKIWPDIVAYGAVLRIFPKYMSVDQLCNTLQWLELKERSVGGFSRQLARLIAISEFDRSALERLRDGLVALVSKGLRWEKERMHVVSDREHLGESLAATCVHGIESNLSEVWLNASVLALHMCHSDHGDDESVKALRVRLTNLDVGDNALLFWAEDRLHKSLHKTNNPRKRFRNIISYDMPIQLRHDYDFEWIVAGLKDKTRDICERELLLEAAIHIPPNRDTWNEHVEGLKPFVSDKPSFVERIDAWLKSSKGDKEYRRWEKKQADRKQQVERRKAKARVSWIQFWREIATQPDETFSSERAWDTAWNLWRAMSHEGDDSRCSGWNRRFIEDHFGEITADKLHRVLMTIWRGDRPTLPSERPEGERNTFLKCWQLGLAAIYAEAEDSNWANKLNDDEAGLAARYAPIEMNGLPQWMEALVVAHPSAVDQILGNELSWELEQGSGGNGHSFLLQMIDYAPTKVARLFLPRLKSWLEANGDRVDDASNAAWMAERVRQVTGVILKHGDETAISHLLETTRRRLEEDLPFELLRVWLPTLMRIDPACGVVSLEAKVTDVEPSDRSEAVAWLATLFGDRYETINLSSKRFTPQLLLRLLRLAYRHVRLEDDAQHDGPYSPDIRDNAEHARDRIVSTLLKAKGEDGWVAKIEMASDPLCEHFRDRILAIAEENWALEIDADALDDAQAVDLDRRYEAAPLTNSAMFTILIDRLDDIDDLLLRDDSPREAWSKISDERLMRREIVQELDHAANSIYTVDQEAVTSEEKETDIRLRSVASSHEAVIELKLGDGRTAKDLRDTIESQLVKKYMAPENRKSGVLLVTIAKERKWEHPDEKRMINIDELLTLLREEAKRVQDSLGGSVAIGVHVLDLRPRLPLENDQKSKKVKAKDRIED